MLRSHMTVRSVGIWLAVAAFISGGFALAPGRAAGSPHRATATTVTVTATEFKFKLSRKAAPVGTIVFKVVNKGKIEHDFKINGKKTPLIKPGKSATLKVVFKKKGRYSYLCTVPGHAALGMKGVLGVGTTAPPPTTPAKTTTTASTGPGGTVQVSEFEYGFKLSPSTIPSGSVTFVMNNTGTVTHNFDISGVKAGPFLDPGKSATMTVNLQAGRSYSFLCDVPGHAALGMRGTFTPSP